MHPGDLTYRNQVVRLSELTVTTDIIEGVTFQNCEIIGPAVVGFLGNTEVRNCSFEGDSRAIVWDLGDDREHVIGAVGFLNCMVVGCKFSRVGVAMPSDQVEGFRQSLGSRPE